MTTTATSLDAMLDQMRDIHGDLAARHAGLCVLHLDAAIAALESHIRRQGTERQAGASVPAPSAARSTASIAD
jgi:hypothetical protein